MAERCHCGAKLVSDHCDYCGCEVYERHCNERVPSVFTVQVDGVADTDLYEVIRHTLESQTGLSGVRVQTREWTFAEDG